MYKPGREITVNDKMQKNYRYTLTERAGKIDFAAAYTPAQMLRMGVFEGKYLNDCQKEYPRAWYTGATKRLCVVADPTVNAFGVKSRMSLQEWRIRGWIPCHENDHDIRGWFQWYCRYWLGRRDPEIDAVQISRWNKIKRHYAQVVKNCQHRQNGKCSDPNHCRPKQRQVLLQWSYPAYD